jgi:hypothetical protein
MPQLHTSLHFHLTPIVMINGSSRRDLILDSQYFCRSIPCKDREPVVVPAVFATRALREVRIGEHSSWGGIPTYMLSIVIRFALGYPASTVVTITGTPEVCPSRSSRTRERSSQCSNARTGYGPNCLTMF